MAGFLASQWISDFLFAFGALFAIINPYGLAFVFLDRTIGLSDVDLLVQVRHVLGLTRVPHSASVMSSTRRTEIPARYISISASSTELSRRR